MLYIYTPADGKNTEGIGAMAQYQIHTYNLSQAIIGARFLGSCLLYTSDAADEGLV